MLRTLAIATLLLGAGGVAHADVRGLVRVGVMPLRLEADTGTPLFGDDIDRAVRAYNTAAAAYDRAHGSTTARIAPSDLALEDTLLVLSPGVEFGGEHMFFRLEGALGFSDRLTSYGVGVYPLNVQLALGKGVAGYVSAGGTASLLRGDGNARGALMSARAAGGVRLLEAVAIEIGYSAFAIGGVVDESRLDQMVDAYDRDAALPAPDGVVAAGDASGLVDVSVGVAF